VRIIYLCDIIYLPNPRWPLGTFKSCATQFICIVHISCVRLKLQSIFDLINIVHTSRHDDDWQNDGAVYLHYIIHGVGVWYYVRAESVSYAYLFTSCCGETRLSTVPILKQPDWARSIFFNNPIEHSQMNATLPIFLSDYNQLGYTRILKY